jgi:hypothetical protein
MIGIGDPVEVRFLGREEGEVWKPATVANVRSGCSISVAFSDGERLEIPLGVAGRWRFA